MADVAATFEALLTCRAVLRAMECAAERPLRSLDTERLTVLAFLHDLGKANAGFQAKQWRGLPRPAGWPVEAGHGDETLALFHLDHTEGQRLLASLPFEAMAGWGEATMDLLCASVSHHGRPVAEQPSLAAANWRAVRAPDGALLYDPALTLSAIGNWIQQHHAAAFESGGEPLPHTPAFVHLFAGLIQLADWLGSDTRFFAYSEPGEQRAMTAPARAIDALHAIGLDVEGLREHLRRAKPSVGQPVGLAAARPTQIGLADADLGSLVILEAETGSGKTEAALWRFARLFEAGVVDGLYFALPTRVAASQLYERVRDFVQRLWPDGGEITAPVAVRALPGYESADGELKIRLPDFQVQWPDQPSDETAHRRWVAESPKRFLAATIAVGTIDQALLGALKVRHAHLRHAMLARSLLVVDEVHASDAYMNVLLEQLLSAHLKLGGHAVLLSATLGAAARTRYLAIGAKRPPAIPAIPTLGDASALPYPAISSCKGGAPHLQAVAGSQRQKVVHWKTLDAIDDPERIAALVADAARQGARVLVIRNTVPNAIVTLQAMERIVEPDSDHLLFSVEGAATLHHSRFSRQDRPLLDRAVEAVLGKHRSGIEGRVVIGTQTLEQSLDIDADLLVSDLCPMDVLLQRLGRLHRHERPDAQRPASCREPRAWVLTPPGHDLSPLLRRSRYGLGRLHDGGGVYPDLRILECTRRLIDAQPNRSIPRDNRLLVERATHPHALLTIENVLGAAWRAVGQAIEGDTGARRGLGHLHALPYNEAFANLRFPDSDEKIATRLGATDRLVEFDPPLPGPFGQLVKQLALRHHQLPSDLSQDAQPHAIQALANEAGFTFALGSSSYRYSRFGIERMRPTTDSDTATGTHA